MSRTYYYRYNSQQLPKVHLVGEEYLKPPHVHKKRKPGEFIVYLVLKGTIDLRENGIVYHLVPGDFILLDPDFVHEGIRPAECNYYYIHFHYAEFERLHKEQDVMMERMRYIRTRSLRSACWMPPTENESEMYLPKYCNLASDPGYAEITGMIRDAVVCNRRKREGYKAMEALLVLQMFITVSRVWLNMNNQETAQRSTILLDSLIGYLNTDYEFSLSSKEIEEKFGVSFDYLNRLFRARTGKTVFRYLNEVRVAHAIELMETTSMQMGEIGESVGFSDASYFSKVFKKYTGVSPKQYIKEHSYS